MKMEWVLILVLLFIVGGALALEALGAEGARVTGIATCLLLVGLMLGGLCWRWIRKRSPPMTGQEEVGSPSDQNPKGQEREA